jgi:hypothetical protein
MAGTNSKHLALRAAVATALAGVAGGRVYQNRSFSLATGVESQVHVNFRQADPEKDSMSLAGRPLDWSTEIELVILARKIADQEAADAVDAIWVQAFAAVMADQTLGGLADYLVPGSASVDDGEGDTSTARLTWTLTVTHRTSNNAIS